MSARPHTQPRATVLVCGSRHWTDRETIEAWLSRLPRGTRVIHGAADGADSIADAVAQDLGMSVAAFAADWETHGKAAGPIRNRRLLQEGKPTRVLAFALLGRVGDLTPGTDDMMRRALLAGIPVTVVPPGGRP